MTTPNRKVIYSASQNDFFKDVLLNQVASKMRDNQNSFSNSKVTDNEYRSWENSPKAVKNLIELSEIKNSHVTFEYQVPYTQRRIDCMIYGKSTDSKDVVVHIELKQWDKVTATNIEGNFVETYTGVANNRVAHPSQQVKGYHDYLTGFVEIFEENKVNLFGYAYCHNYEKKIGFGLHDPIYDKIIEAYPIYSKNDVLEFSLKLKQLLGNGDGLSVFNKLCKAQLRHLKNY